MSVKQISVFLENKPGALFAMTTTLAKENIDMRAFSLAETSEFGIARLIVDDPYRTVTALKEAGFVSSVTEVLGVAVSDTPGGLNDVLDALREANVNVEYMYAFVGVKRANSAYMIFRVTDNAKASAVLAAKGIALVSEEEIANL